MKWIKVDPANLPDEEVLAKSPYAVAVGYVFYFDNPRGAKTKCEDGDGNVLLYNITHYLPVEMLLKLEID